jgi:L,D-peptidoglycan transpeptidase YkuD (ErfK/YbiS/YcfS/YnhG family)
MVLFLVVSVLAGGYFWFHSMSLPPVIPSPFMADLPPNCRQVVLVLSANVLDTAGRLWLLHKKIEREWQPEGESIPVSLGRHGMAWGLGEHTCPAPEEFRLKKEGDDCSPAGVFRLPFAFGEGANGESLHLPYVSMTSTHFGIDDAKSRYYNQVVDASSSEVTRDWDSAETMLRSDGLYRRGAMVAHNPMNVPGAGSCIFLHLWRGPGQPTAGCTAMAKDDLKRVLEWLDPMMEPRLVQGGE